ncbi:MAG: FtsQ-type POTRA domain-containing protein [Firmicutes bacterium]|nr:FtsQ-type POTRA domain-containing protein [Bacillota bacterium]
MTHKRLLVLLIVFIFVAAIGISAGTIFVVRNVEVDFRGDLDYLYAYREQIQTDLDQRARSIRGRNILFGVNRRALRENIEGVDNRIRVTNIEMHFPNRVVIRVRERFAVYGIQTQSGSTFIFDMHMRFVSQNTDHNVIDIGEQFISDSGGNSIRPLDISRLDEKFNAGDFAVGSYLDNLFIPEPDEPDTAHFVDQRAKVSALRNLASLYWGADIFEDSVRHMFYSVLFSVSPHDEFVMRITLRHQEHSTASGSIIEINGVDDITEFGLMLANIDPFLFEIRVAAGVTTVRIDMLGCGLGRRGVRIDIPGRVNHILAC